MTISVKLLDSYDTIKSKINKAFVDELNNKIIRSQSKALSVARQKVSLWVAEQPEVQSISRGGDLAGHFGLRAGTSTGIATSIIEGVALATTFKFKKFDSNFKGYAELNFQPSHFANLLALPQSFVTTEKGTQLHWLDWLLTQGNRAIIVGYEYIPDTGKGRAGLGSMHLGGMWRVPPEYAGHRDDNFITRAFKNKQKDVEAIFREVLR